ncbi:Ribosome association toxin RatA [Salmonella enterica subsp. enterica serovar Napoli]|nr:Ribosome association toxin RatA [Salmonella enterica subsp. enterica serovar Napoli]
MPQISRTALVPYSAEQMYQLVNDVQSYPQFCPVCWQSCPGVIASTDDGGC